MELTTLLAKAKSAAPDRRIEWRDRIADFGASAIDGVRPWLSDPALAAFAVRVIERAASHGDPAHAARVLRAAKGNVPPAVAPDVEWALQRLKGSGQQAGIEPTDAPPASGPPPRRPATTQRRRSASEPAP